MFDYIKVILSFLNRKDKKNLIGLILLMTLTACMELVGVGAIFPYIRVLGDQKIIQKNYFLNSIFHFFHFSSNDSFLIFIGILIFIMLTLRVLMSCLNNYYQAKFSQGLNIRISAFCIRSYIFMPYQKIIVLNTSTISKHILTDVVYTIEVIVHMLSITTDVMLVISLVFLILWINFKIVLLSVSALTIFLFLALARAKERIKRISAENEYYAMRQYKIAADIFQGLKDIKINNVESYFIDKFLFLREKNAKNLVILNVVANIPSLLMNLMSFGMLLLILLYLLFSHGSLTSILPTVGVIAVAVQRMLPAMSRISVSLGNVRQYHANVMVVRQAIDELKERQHIFQMKQNSQESIRFERELRFKNISYQYPRAEKEALKDISLIIRKNTSLGIVGASGAGKSTLVDLILGLLPIKSGSIYCDDSVITHKHIDLSHLVGYVPQQTHLIDDTLLANIALGVPKGKIDYQALECAVKIAQLQDLVKELPKGLRTYIGEKGVKLSGGQRQRVGIARALYRDPDIIVMDEATNALDSVTENEFNETLKLLMGKKTLIIIAHRHSSVLFCDKLVVLDDGKIVSEGNHKELINTSKIYRDLYALEAN